MGTKENISTITADTIVVGANYRPKSTKELQN